MISSEVTMTTSVIKSAILRKTKGGTDFVTFGVEVPVKGHDGSSRNFSVSVSADGGQELASSLVPGVKVDISGTLFFRKTDDALYMNLRASNYVKTCNATEADKFEGVLHFIGKIGQKGVETRQDKKGKPYSSISAWSGERDQEHPEQFHYIWVRFRDFKGLNVACAQPKECVEMTGNLQLSLYNNNLQIDSLLATIAPYHRENNK